MRSDHPGGSDHNSPNSVPVTVITGFLGSGKTTVLNQLLRTPDLADTAVIINEFGEVSLDHLLIEQAIENAVLLKNGCICCTVRGDILDTIDELFRKRESGELPWFRRIAIETTGLADPAPVVHTLADARQPCHLDGIVVTVDAVHVGAQLREREEARNQLALADRVLLTKTDLVTPAEADAVEPVIRAFNARSPIRRVVDGEVTPENVFGLGPEAHPAHWLRPVVEEHHIRDDHGTGDDHLHHHHHDHGVIASTVLGTLEPIPGPSLALWLDSLLSLHGADVLRLKGIVRVAGVEQPVVVQAVHHVLHRLVGLPPRAEAAWDSPGGEIVVIHRGLPEAGLRASLEAALNGRESEPAVRV
jgi:G3E family GTPase